MDENRRNKNECEVRFCNFLNHVFFKKFFFSKRFFLENIASSPAKKKTKINIKLFTIPVQSATKT